MKGRSHIKRICWKADKLKRLIKAFINLMEYNKKNHCMAKEEIFVVLRQARASLTVRRVETTRVQKPRYVNNRKNSKFVLTQTVSLFQNRRQWNGIWKSLHNRLMNSTKLWFTSEEKHWLIWKIQKSLKRSAECIEAKVLMSLSCSIGVQVVRCKIKRVRVNLEILL